MSNCPRFLTLCRDCCREKWLPAETARVIVFPVESLGRGRSITRTNSVGSHLSCTTVSTESKKARTGSEEANLDRKRKLSFFKFCNLLTIFSVVVVLVLVVVVIIIIIITVGHSPIFPGVLFQNIQIFTL